MPERMLQQQVPERNTDVVPFGGFDVPNFTPVPDEFLDDVLPQMKSEAEVKVLLYAMRRTYGFKRDSDNISISQLLRGITTKGGVHLDRGTGLSKKHLLKALDSLEEEGLLIRTRRRSEKYGDEATNYQLRLRSDWQAAAPDSPLVGAHGLRSYKRFTPVLDQILDELLPDLTLGELKVLLYITRRTQGFKRDSASISRTQMLQGLRTSDDRVLDRGAGVSENTLERALKGLREKKVIVTQRQRSADEGDRPTSYQLNILEERPPNPLPQEDTSPRGVFLGEGGTPKRTPPPGDLLGEGGTPKRTPHKKQLRQTAIGEPEQQQFANDHGVVVAALADVGVTRTIAEDLARQFPTEHIRTQIDMLTYRTANDPAAVLVKAIREEWAPPASYRTPEQLEEEACEVQRTEAELDAWQQAQLVSRETVEIDRPRTRHEIIAFRPFQAMAADSRTVWATAMVELAGQAGADAYLRGARLLAREGDDLIVGAGTTYAAEWLQRRVAHRAAQLLSALGGERVGVRFVAETDWRGATRSGTGS